MPESSLQKIRRSLRGGLCHIAGRATSGSSGSLKSPIFIVGTGRCGTTLLIRILKSHPEVSVFPGEANEFWHPRLFPYEKAQIDAPPIEVDPESFTQISVDSWPSNQAERIRHLFSGYYLLSGSRDAFFVKSAMISFMIPEILKIYPKARFLHIYRSGPSVVESYVKKNLGNYSKYQPTEAEYRLQCARYWNACLLEIERVKEACNLTARSAFWELSYEELCDKPEELLQELVLFIGVDAKAFSFDMSSIKSKNFKVGSWDEDKRWEQSLAAMSQAMRLKGYIPA